MLKKIKKLEQALIEKDPDVYYMKTAHDYHAYKRMKRKEPNKRFVIKVTRSVMWYINIIGEKLP